MAQKWKIANKLMGRKAKNDISKKLRFTDSNGTPNETKDEETIAEKFNDYFTKVGEQIASSTPKTSTKYETFLKRLEKPKTMFKFSEVAPITV